MSLLTCHCIIWALNKVTVFSQLPVELSPTCISLFSRNLSRMAEEVGERREGQLNETECEVPSPWPSKLQRGGSRSRAAINLV